MHLPKSAALQVLLLKEDGVAVARSYEGGDWEGVVPTPLHPDCSTPSSDAALSDCTIVSGSQKSYVVEAASAPATTADEDAARFLSQGACALPTFPPLYLSAC